MISLNSKLDGRMHGEQHSRQLATNENQAPNSEEPTVDETTDTTSTPLQHPLLTYPAIVHHPTQQPEQPVVSAPTSRQSVVYNAPAIIEAAGPVVQLNLEEGITIDTLLNTFNQGLFFPSLQMGEANANYHIIAYTNNMCHE